VFSVDSQNHSATTHAFRREMLPPARSFYEREVGRLTLANAKGHFLADCCFHESKSHRSLSAWQDVSDADRRAIAQQSAEREKKQAEQARLKSLAHEERIMLRDEIHTSLRETEAQYMSSMEMEKL
jgi:hypothetical protein